MANNAMNYLIRTTIFIVAILVLGGSEFGHGFEIVKAVEYAPWTSLTVNNNQKEVTVISGDTIKLAWGATNEPISCIGWASPEIYAWSGSFDAPIGTSWRDKYITLTTSGTYKFYMKCKNTSYGNTSDVTVNVKSTSSYKQTTYPPYTGLTVIGGTNASAHIYTGEAVKVSWSATNAPTACIASSNPYKAEWSGEQTPTADPNWNSKYITFQQAGLFIITLKCKNESGVWGNTAQATITASARSSNAVSQISSQPFVTTIDSVKNTGEYTAIVYGKVNPNGGATTAWFEFGTNITSLTLTTYKQSIGSGTNEVNYNVILEYLSPNTTYYYRAVAENGQGKQYGTIGSIITKAVNKSETSNNSAPSVSTNSSSNVSTTSATLRGFVNPNNSSTTAWFEYGATQSLGQTTSIIIVGGGVSETNSSVTIFNLFPNTIFYYRVAAQNSYGTTKGSVLSFTTNAEQQQQQQQQQGGAPIARTESHSGVSTTSATLSGSANPNGASTEGWFEYGSTQSLGSSTSRQNIGSGTGFNNFNFILTSLSPNTTYYYRAIAQNNFGTSQGIILSLTTQSQQVSVGAPLVNTTSSSNVSTTSAILYGSVNPNNSSTTAWFEYGQTQSFGFTTSSSSVGSSNSNNSFSASVFNLSPNTTYYYRAVAQNSYGTSYGSVLTLSTGSQSISGSSPFVNTNSASLISTSSATLYGSANPNNSYTTGWFEYGASGSLNNTTSSSALGSSNSYQSYSSTILNLSPNTTYSYRAAAQNSYGTVYGTLLTFTTGTNQATTNQDLSGIANSLAQLTSALAKLSSLVGGFGANRVTERVIERVEVASVSSDLAKLTFTADKENLDPGDKVVFTVQVEPLANLTNAALTIKLNSGFEFESTSANNYSKLDNTFTYNLGNFSAGNIQVFKINAHLANDFKKDGAENGSITSTATFSYADASGNAKTPLFSSLETKVGSSGLFASMLNVIPFGNGIIILLIAFLVLLVAVAVRKLLS